MSYLRLIMELYVHIPFCVRKCLYCDFLSFAADREQKEKYVDAVIKELGSFSGLLKSMSGFDTAFIGGGTPSVLDNDLSGKLLAAVSETLSDGTEFSIECNPGTVDAEKLRLYRRYGVNRLSIGLQSANDRELAAIGRIHNLATFMKTYEAAREAGFENINADIMSGLPGQSLGDWENTLRTVGELELRHISAYSLIIEPGTPFYDMYGTKTDKKSEGILPLPDEDVEREMYHMTSRILSEYGFHRYEISNFAKEGSECRHNLGYWKNEEYLGVGIGASSFVRAGAGILDTSDNVRTKHFIRYKNIEDINEYISKVMNGRFDEIRTEREEVDPAGAEEEFIILRMRLSEGILKEEYKERFGNDFDEKYADRIRRFAEWGFLNDTPERICFTEEGFDISNTILAEMI